MPLSDIQTAVTGIANRRDLTANPALLMTFIGQGLRRIERTLRIPSMERLYIEKTVADTSISSFPVPADLLQVIDVFAHGRSLLKEGFRQLSPLTRQCGLPQAYSRIGAAFYIAPPLVGPDEIMLTYYGTLGPLVAATDDNEITLACPELLTYAALTYVGDYYRLDQTQAWQATFMALMAEVQDQADQLANTGGPSVVASPHGDY